jgi:hypothetical protein
VDSCALELDCLLLSHGHLVHLRHSEAKVALAGELRLVDWSVVDFVHAVWNRLLHDDVSVSSGEKGSRSHDSGSERHDAGIVGSSSIVQRQFWNVEKMCRECK